MVITGPPLQLAREFFSKVDPYISVISAGENNNYGHPTKEVLERIKDTKVFRTDLKGTIVIISDGKSGNDRCS